VHTEKKTHATLTYDRWMTLKFSRVLEVVEVH